MKQRGRPKKDPFHLLTEEERDGIAAMKDDQVRDRIATAALDYQTLEDAMKVDQDLTEKKDQVKMASEPYRDGKKRLKQVVRYSRSILDARGKESGCYPDAAE